MPIPKSFIDDLVSRTDIAELVGGYVRLTKRSGNNMFGLCPFHSEKTASFSVSSDKQIYYCFGCGKGGGAINFAMEIESLTYTDAIEFLAKRAGLTVPEDGASDEIAGKRRRILEMNRDAARYFYEMLASPLAKPARDYLAKRGITKTYATRFGLGAAPDAWTLLVDAMTKRGYSKQELIEAGLARSGQKEGGAYDLFRNRLIFPVIDARGAVVGFSGRILGDGEPKYLNSPETLVFNKSRVLFALNLAKKTKAGMIILAEGNIDVVALHQAGFDSAVASLGTSLTQEQARLMSRYTDKAVIAYDSDEAGRRAALRAIPLLEKTGMGVKVVEIGESKDPDEYLKRHGADSFRALVERSDNHIEYRLASIRDGADLTTDDGRLIYLAGATDLLAELESKPEREIYGARVARTAGVSSESIDNEVEKKVKARWSRFKKEQERKATRPAATLQPEDRSLKYSNEYSAAAEEGLVSTLIKDPTLLRAAEEMGFSYEEFSSDFLAKVFLTLRARVMEGRDARESMILAELEENEASRLAAILQKTEALTINNKSVGDYIEKIRMEKFKTVEPDYEMLLEIKKFREKKDIGGE